MFSSFLSLGKKRRKKKNPLPSDVKENHAKAFLLGRTCKAQTCIVQ